MILEDYILSYIKLCPVLFSFRRLFTILNRFVLFVQLFFYKKDGYRQRNVRQFLQSA